MNRIKIHEPWAKPWTLSQGLTLSTIRSSLYLLSAWILIIVMKYFLCAGPCPGEPLCDHTPRHQHHHGQHPVLPPTSCLHQGQSQPKILDKDRSKPCLFTFIHGPAHGESKCKQAGFWQFLIHIFRINIGHLSQNPKYLHFFKGSLRQKINVNKWDSGDPYHVETSSSSGCWRVDRNVCLLCVLFTFGICFCQLCSKVIMKLADTDRHYVRGSLNKSFSKIFI